MYKVERVVKRMTVRIKLAEISNALRIMPGTGSVWMIALL